MPAHTVSPGVRLATAMLVAVAACSSALAATAESHDSDTPSWRSVVDKFAQEHFHNPAWGYSHSQRDYQLGRARGG